ncbi:MAG: hypothetical protein H6R00_3955 [Proteobacteria bacterium]|nr:hypothetical protein [Pseudomonadota bacterium]
MMATAEAATPSFDCDGVQSLAERLICRDDALAALDMRLAREFARALAQAAPGKVIDLLTDQRVWRAGLLKCGRTDSPKACIADAYERRMRTLVTGTEKPARSGR